MSTPHAVPPPAVKRVLLLGDRPDLSGVAFVARHLGAGLRAAGVEVRVWFHRPGERLGDFLAHGLAAGIHPGYGLAGIGRQSAVEAREFAPDIVHAQSIRVADRTRRLARRTGAAFVVNAHHPDPAEGRRIARWPEAGVAAISEAVRERLANGAGIARDRIRVIPNALDLAEYPRPAFDTTDAMSRRLPVVGVCGRLAPEKGQRVFLRMAAELAARGLDAEYVIVGDGPDRCALDDLASYLGIRQRVTFAPMGDPHRIEHMDVLVEPSVVEGLGLSVLQAQALGVPVVASGAGGVFGLVDDGATGLMVPPGDVEAMARAVVRLLRDPAGRMEMARQARDRVEEAFDVRRVARSMLAFYAERRELHAVNVRR